MAIQRITSSLRRPDQERPCKFTRQYTRAPSPVPAFGLYFALGYFTFGYFDYLAQLTREPKQTYDAT